MKISVCAYCRVSLDDADQLNSLMHQRQYFEQEAEKSEKYEFVKIYADAGLSATSWKKREQFKQMLIDAGLDIDILKKELRVSLSDREPKFKRILIKDVSRFSRNAQQGLEIVTKLREKGVHLDFVSVGLTTENMTNNMIVGFFLLAAEHESIDKSVKVRFGQKQSAKNGVIKTANNFYGYNYIKETNELKIIKEEAKVIKKMYELYSEGFGFRRILNYLEEKSIKTRRGKNFVQQSVRRILENPAYKGWLVRNKMDSPLAFTFKTYATLKPEEEWEIRKGRIPAIISEELWDNVQEIKKSKLHHKQRRGINNAKSKYADLIKCGKCGNSYTRNIEPKNGRIFYNCGLKKREGIKLCDNPNVGLKEIEADIKQLCQGGLHSLFVVNKEENIHQLMQIQMELNKKTDDEKIKLVEKLNQKVLNLNEKKKRLIDLYAEGDFDKETLMELTSKVDEKINETSLQIKKESISNDDVINEVNKIDSIIDDINDLKFKEIYEFDDIKHLISKIIVDEHGQLTVHLKAFDTIEKFINKYEDMTYIKSNPTFLLRSVGD